jgi:hypothetical protein
MTTAAATNEYGDCLTCDGTGLADCQCDAGTVFGYDSAGMVTGARRCRSCRGRGRVSCPELPHPITTD